jgi:hypothetical protein
MAGGSARAWTLVLFLLMALRVPSIVQPAGGDQSLYLYSGQRVSLGDVPYRDVWDQKPPGIFFIYAALWRLYPHESIVPAVDLAAAGITAGLLVILGRRLVSPGVGFGAGLGFLALSDPSLQRFGGLAVRGQCETFIALAVAAALVAVTARERRTWMLVLGGVWLAVAFWLKYNAATYVAPIALAAVVWPPGSSSGWRTRWRTLLPIGAGAAVFSLAVLTYFGAHGALDDLKRATIDYNLEYSRETYEGPAGLAGYLALLPFARARVDLLWFAGVLGVLVLVLRRRRDPAAIIVPAWIAAAVVSIAVNGARGLPQYFVQATPALALAAASGIAIAWQARALWRLGLVAAVVVGLWRVGVEPSPLWRPRLGGLPQAVGNLRLDFDRLMGKSDVRAYRSRFGGAGETGKFSVTAVDDLTARIRQTTSPADRVLVFGFAGGGVLARSGRMSASRFFWSRPVVVEFAQDVPRYGSRGLLAELMQNRPAVVALQRRDWGIGEPAVPDSAEFFMANDALRGWLEAGYALEEDAGVFAVWRRRS